VKVSILIPVYNEFRTLPHVMERVRSAPLPPGCAREIIVVDDGSTDGTTEVLKQYAEAGIVTGRYSASNSGKGMALRAGIEIASGDVIVIQDGDLEYDPRDFAAMVAAILSGDADIVYGSRFRGNPLGMAWKNRIANWILTATANLLYDAHITDEATAYKAFRANLLRDLPLECRGFEFCPEVTAKLLRLGHRIHEIPIRYNARGIADGKKIRARDGFIAFWTLLKYRFIPLHQFQTQGYALNDGVQESR
jgi:glycosyltransferase involved in cell wall biosynthesis